MPGFATGRHGRDAAAAGPRRRPPPPAPELCLLRCFTLPQNFWMGIRVGNARKKYGITYPACYAPAGRFPHRPGPRRRVPPRQH